MIDIEKANKVVHEYMNKYDISKGRTRTKIEHIERVAKISRKIAEGLNLSKEDVDLAELIGLLHDIGRFEQIRLYDTFIDSKSVNHGELGAKILFDDGLIEIIIDDRQYDEIIKTAIINHNRNANNIEYTNERELLHSKIIRDADKTDILYILTWGDKIIAWEKEDLSDDEITDEIYRQFVEDKNIHYRDRKTAADILVSHFAYIFDYNFKNSIKIVKENNYIEKIYNRFHFNNEQTRMRMEKIYNITKEYIENFN